MSGQNLGVCGDDCLEGFELQAPQITNVSSAPALYEPK